MPADGIVGYKAAPKTQISHKYIWVNRHVGYEKTRVF